MKQFDESRVEEVFNRVNILTGRLLASEVVEFSVRIEKNIVFIKESKNIEREAFRLTDKRQNEQRG